MNNKLWRMCVSSYLSSYLLKLGPHEKVAAQKKKIAARLYIYFPYGEYLIYLTPIQCVIFTICSLFDSFLKNKTEKKTLIVICNLLLPPQN